jgi:hypothetical protein
MKYIDSANVLLTALKTTFNNAEIVFSGSKHNLARIMYHNINPAGEGITTIICGETYLTPETPFFYQEVDENGETNTIQFHSIESLIDYCKSGEEIGL